MLLHGQSTVDYVANTMVWEETPFIQQLPGFHPCIRFGSWDITRFTRSTTYMFTTPGLVQQGQYNIKDNHYHFWAVMANELENADIAKLLADESPEQAQAAKESYAASISSFDGDYNPEQHSLTISYPVKGHMKNFQLFATTEGDDQLASSVSDSERGMLGLWHAPDPFPNRMDAHSREKYQEDGLQHFVPEAKASDEAQFDMLDLRQNETFRSHATIGNWSRTGSVLTLKMKGATIQFQVSTDGQKLLRNGKVVFVRG